MTSGTRSTATHTIVDFVRGYTEDRTLRGFRCGSCGKITATWGVACAQCGRDSLEEFPLGDRGAVVAFTLITVPGEELLNDAPYAYVIVELDGGGRISGWMPSVRSATDLALGARVRFAPGYKPGVQFEKESGAPTA